MNFDDGVKSYIVGTCSISVHFPVNWKGEADVKCSQCAYFNWVRNSCELTKNVCEYPHKHIASTCPLVFTGETKSKFKGDKNDEQGSN